MCIFLDLDHFELIESGVQNQEFRIILFSNKNWIIVGLKM